MSNDEKALLDKMRVLVGKSNNIVMQITQVREVGHQTAIDNLRRQAQSMPLLEHMALRQRRRDGTAEAVLCEVDLTATTTATSTTGS